MLKEKTKIYGFAVVLFVIIAFTMIVLNISLPAVYADETDDECTAFFNDHICDDSPNDCGNKHESDASVDRCNECQTMKFGTLGFNDCSTTIRGERREQTPVTRRPSSPPSPATPAEGSRCSPDSICQIGSDEICEAPDSCPQDCDEGVYDSCVKECADKERYPYSILNGGCVCTPSNPCDLPIVTSTGEPAESDCSLCGSGSDHFYEDWLDACEPHECTALGTNCEFVKAPGSFFKQCIDTSSQDVSDSRINMRIEIIDSLEGQSLTTPNPQQRVKFTATAPDNTEIKQIKILIDGTSEGICSLNVLNGDCDQSCSSNGDCIKSLSITRGPYLPGKEVQYQAKAMDSNGREIQGLSSLENSFTVGPETATGESTTAETESDCSLCGINADFLDDWLCRQDECEEELGCKYTPFEGTASWFGGKCNEPITIERSIENPLAGQLVTFTITATGDELSNVKIYIQDWSPEEVEIAGSAVDQTVYLCSSGSSSDTCSIEKMFITDHEIIYWAVDKDDNEIPGSGGSFIVNPAGSSISVRISLIESLPSGRFVTFTPTFSDDIKRVEFYIIDSTTDPDLAQTTKSCSSDTDPGCNAVLGITTGPYPQGETIRYSAEGYTAQNEIVATSPTLFYTLPSLPSLSISVSEESSIIGGDGKIRFTATAVGNNVESVSFFIDEDESPNTMEHMETCASHNVDSLENCDLPGSYSITRTYSAGQVVTYAAQAKIDGTTVSTAPQSYTVPSLIVSHLPVAPQAGRRVSFFATANGKIDEVKIVINENVDKVGSSVVELIQEICPSPNHERVVCSASTFSVSRTFSAGRIVSYNAMAKIDGKPITVYSDQQRFQVGGCLPKYASGTSCTDVAFTLTDGVAKENMCASEEFAQQYYKIKIPVGKSCKIKWTLTGLENSGYGLFADFDKFICHEGSGAHNYYECTDRYYMSDSSKGRTCESPDNSLTFGDYYAMVRHGSAAYLGKTYDIKAELVDCV